MTTPWRTGWLLVVLLEFGAASAAGQSIPLTDSSLTLIVGQDAGPWTPYEAPRMIPVEGTVTCGNREADNPSYTVTIRVAYIEHEVTATIEPGSVNLQFTSPRCLAGGPNITQTYRSNLTVFADQRSQAFHQFGITVNATLVRQGQTDALDSAEAQTNFTMGYVPGLQVATPVNVKGLVDGRTEIDLRVNNTANGASSLAGELLNASTSLNVEFERTFALNRSEQRPVRLTVRSASGCPEEQRSFQVRFVASSPDPRGNRTADWVGTFLVSCDKNKRAVPGIEPALMALGVLAAGLKTRGRRQAVD